MGAEVIDTNVLVLATAAVEGWKCPRIPIDDPEVLKRVYEWLKQFREDSSRLLVMDFPHNEIRAEYRKKLSHQHYGPRVMQHKFDTGALKVVELDFVDNGIEKVAVVFPQHEVLLHDLGDRKMIMGAFIGGAPIYNATDGDWTEPAVVAALADLEVEVIQLLTAQERAACKERKEDP